jgi:mannose-6-phosphate isomerase
MEIDYAQPFELLPNRVWRTYKGGATLDRIAGKDDVQDGHFPEDWAGSVTRAANAGREELVDEGMGRARGVDGQIYSMEQIYQTNPEQALGTEHVRAFGAHPHLLVKLLDAAMRLHIQAHPSVAWARQHLNAESGKTEAWCILETRQEEAWVYLGFQHPPQPEQWRRIVEAQDLQAIQACFERVPVAPGDVLLVDGGVPHAIGPGIFMIEVQEPTDYVVRCEYAHGGLALPESARTMGLGLERVLDMFDYAQYSLEQVCSHFGPRPTTLSEDDGGKEIVLLGAPQTASLELRHLECSSGMALGTDGRFSILIVIEGQGRLLANGREMALQPWSKCYLPAAVDSVELEGELTVVRCLPPLAG